MTLKAKRRAQAQTGSLERDRQLCFVLMRLYQALQNSGGCTASEEIAELEAKLKKLQG